MNRRIAALLGAGAIGLGLGASAQTTPPAKSPPTSPDTAVTPPSQPPSPQAEKVSGQQSVDPAAGKHLALVNVYLEGAVLNAKALSSLSDMNVPAAEKNVKELTRNLDISIKGAMMHLGQLQKMSDPKMTRIEDLNQSLKDTKASLLKLKKAKAADFDAQIDQLGSNLSSSQQIFRDLAKTANFTALEEINLQTVPVRGEHDSETQDIERVPRDPNDVIPPKHDVPLPEPAQPMSPPSGTMPPSGTSPPKY